MLTCIDRGLYDVIDEVASGTMESQIQGPPFGPFSNNLTAENPNPFDITTTSHDELNITQTSKFTIDGRSVRVPRGMTIGNSVFRINPTCLGGKACAVAGTLNPTRRR